MSGGPEDFAAAVISVLASACGPEGAARAGFEQAEAVQVAQLKALCSVTFEEGISVELSEALAPMPLISDLQDAVAVEVVRDRVVLSLVKHATTPEAVCWLSHAMRRITTGDDDASTRHRQDVFATEAVRDGFFVPLVQHATSAEAVYWLSSAMYNITAGSDAGAARRSDIFATEAVRDGFFVPLVKHATSAEAVYWLSSAMCNTTAEGAADIFATEAVRDGFFVPLVTHATSPEACQWLSSAMCNITNGTDAGAARRSDLFGTEAVRDGFFVPLVKHATSAEACRWLSTAMSNITAGTDAGAAHRSDLFGTEAVRDGFFIPLVKHATSQESVEWLSHACASVSLCSATPFATAEMCDSFFLPLARALDTNGFAAGDVLLSAFSTVARAVGVCLKKFVTPTVATEFLRLLDSFEGLPTTLSVRDLLAESYPLALHPLVSNARVIKTVIPKNTQLFWDLEEVLSANINGHNDDYVKSRLAQRERPLMFTLVGATAVSNPVLEKRFEVMKTMMEMSGEYSPNELRERRSFHGSHPRNIDGILTTSLLPFKHPLNSCQNQTDDGCFGVNTSGVYVGRYVDYVLKYSNREAPLKPDDEVDVIMFKTLPGKSKHIETASRGLQPTSGFDSHSSPDFLEWYLFESAQLCPTHVLRVRAVENTRTWADDGLPPLPPPAPLPPH